MAKSDIIIDAIQKQIDDASLILGRINRLNRVYTAFDDDVTPGVKRYEKVEVKPIEDAIEEWKTLSLVTINSCFKGGCALSESFVQAIPSAHVYNDAKQDLERVVSKGVSILKAILLQVRLDNDLDTQQESSGTVIEIPSTGSPKLFISHSSKDKSIISRFVEQILQLGLGIQDEDIVYTSEEVFGVEPGENIVKFIKDNIGAVSVVLLMVSQNYKKSEVCLNEMGAAWVLNKKCISVLLPDVDFSQVGWITSLDKAVSMTNKDQMSALCVSLAGAFSVDLGKCFKKLSLNIDKFVEELKAVK